MGCRCEDARVERKMLRGCSLYEEREERERVWWSGARARGRFEGDEEREREPMEGNDGSACAMADGTRFGSSQGERERERCI